MISVSFKFFFIQTCGFSKYTQKQMSKIIISATEFLKNKFFQLLWLEPKRIKFSELVFYIYQNVSCFKETKSWKQLLHINPA